MLEASSPCEKIQTQEKNACNNEKGTVILYIRIDAIDEDEGNAETE